MRQTAYERLKKFRRKRSEIRANLYLARNWRALGTDASKWGMHECAARKRWLIYYDRRQRQVQEPREPRHWVGPAERERKRAKASINPVFYTR